jgi:peroxiredoxin
MNEILQEHKENSMSLRNLNVPHLAKWSSAFAIVTLFISITPSLFAQTDVHASLIAPADRKPAPAIQLTSDTGQAKQLSDYKGKVVLLNFWASDCGGCVIELPSIIDLQAANKNKSFAVVGISMDIPYEELKNEQQAWDKVKPFMVKSKINYPVLMGNESTFKTFGLNQLPDTLLLDKNGNIAAVYVGIISKDNAQANINKLLSE